MGVCRLYLYYIIPTANVAAQGLRRNPITIGAILFCPIEEYVDSIIDGIHSSAADLEKYNVNVDVHKIEYTNRFECLSKAVDMIKTLSKKKYNGIVLFLSSMLEDLIGLTELIDELTEKGISFATVANDIPDCARVLHVGINAYTAGQMAAELLEMSCRGEDVAMLVTSTSSPVNMEYIKGFTEYSENGIFSNVKIYEHFDSDNKILDAVQQMLSENPNLKGVYMSTASSHKACEHIKSLNKDGLFIITTDLLSETPSLLTDKTTTATIFQNPYQQGRTVVKMLYNYITKKKDEGVYLLAPHIILSSNLKYYQ